MRSADLMLFGKIEHMVAARGNRRQLRVQPIDPLIGVHVQLGNKPTSDKAYSDFRHRRDPSRESSSYCLQSCAEVCVKQCGYVGIDFRGVCTAAPRDPSKQEP